MFCFVLFFEEELKKKTRHRHILLNNPQEAETPPCRLPGDFISETAPNGAPPSPP